LFGEEGPGVFLTKEPGIGVGRPALISRVGKQRNLAN